MVQSPRFGPHQKEARLAKAGAAVQLQRLRQTPLPLAPTPANADRLWLYLSKGFHFLFWEVIRVLHVPFITKEAGKRGCVLCHPGKSK